MNWAIRDKEPDKNKQLHVLSVKEYEELEEKFTKYKRAFEILKDNAQISIKNCLWDYLVINQENGGQIQFRLSKEEKELLEELMKGE